MAKYLFLAVVVLMLVGGALYLLPEKGYGSDADTLGRGKSLFTRHCMSCHGLQDEGFGPPLGGVTTLLPQKSLLKFIKDPSNAIQSGDERASALQSRYKLLMPSFEWMSETEIISILAYIHNQSILYRIEPQTIAKRSAEDGLTGRLVAPVKESGLQLELEDVVQLPMLGSSTDLGVATLRAHPSGDGTLFASDQNGAIYRITDGRATVFLEVSDYIENYQSGPGIATGLGSFDFHPDFLNNGLLFITHAETYKGQPADYAISDSLKSEVQWIIGEWKMNDPDDTTFAGGYRELLRLHAPNFGHGCQDISFIPDLEKGDPDYGLLYIGYGDGGSNNIGHPELGHHLRSFLGTIIRIDPAGTNSRNGKYGIPPTNPFVNESDSHTVKEIFAYGFRNPHRMAWDKSNGNRMLVTDIGESNIEELNIVENGGDYGWPNREGDFGIATLTDLKTVFELTPSDLALYKRPFAQYDHEDGFAISGGFVYEGPLAPLKNKYVFGDIVNGKLFYVNIDPELSDSTIYELGIVQNGVKTDLQEMSQSKRLHLRIAYDPYQQHLYVITKVDGMIRRVVNAF